MEKATKQGKEKSNGTQASSDPESIEAAAKRWVSRFNSIPQNVIEKLIRSGDDISEFRIPDNSTEYDEPLPAWDTMWSFDDISDIQWLDDIKNRKAMAACGFRIYEQEDFGYIFGIDGYGYDFYEAHWIPLYEARGLLWHVAED